jgi:hypothetical protein
MTCHTNFELPVCWNAQSGYLLASTTVMIESTRLPIPTTRKTRKTPPPMTIPGFSRRLGR